MIIWNHSKSVEKRFGLASTDSYNFTTLDDRYKCTFKNSPERTGVPFNRTIIQKMKMIFLTYHQQIVQLHQKVHVTLIHQMI